MKKENLSEEQKKHRKMGIKYFNLTWDFLDKEDRTKEEIDEMINASHASRFHWGKLNKPVNNERGEWQISRVYSTLKRFEPAYYHAKRCIEICKENNIGDFDIAFAYEAMARAYSIKGDEKNKEKYLNLAKKAGEIIDKKEDKDYFFSELNTIE